ncbi:hypothetical protein [Aeromonas veronii]|uniref:Uncharacterized protein n=1 Tax=Aeromonas veronii TaxID=654 RepID=A0A2T4N012_AERVE|nr:hypothetical protein [Aeromonas veronii]PTH80117.1 hypothetical protein DAA48_16265 [Aeromonas veronii]
MEKNVTLISDYQHYLMMLKELSNGQHEQKMEEYLELLTLKDNIPLDLDATPADLAKLDFSVFQLRKAELEKVAPEIKNLVDEKILSFNPFTPLYDAGFDKKQVTNMPVGFLNDIQTTMAFEKEFPDEEKKPLSERLAAAKTTITSLMKNDKAKLAMSTVMFSVAVGTGGGAALAVSATMFATKLAENKFVQELLTKTEQRIDKYLIDAGYKKEKVEERKSTFGEKLEAITSSKWYSRIKMPIAACLLITGIGTAAALSMSHAGMESLPNMNVAALVEKGRDLVSGLASNFDILDTASVSDVKETAQSAFDSIFNSAPEVPKFGDIDYGTNDVFAFEPVKPELSFDILDAKTDGLYGEVNASMDPITPVTTEYTAEKGSTLWEMAKEHYQSHTGHEPSGKQIIAMINDLGLEDPNSIDINQTFEFTNDLGKYDNLDKVTADWLDGGHQGSSSVNHASHAQSVDAAVGHVHNAAPAGQAPASAVEEPFIKQSAEIREPFDKSAYAKAAFINKFLNNETELSR